MDGQKAREKFHKRVRESRIVHHPQRELRELGGIILRHYDGVPEDLPEPESEYLKKLKEHHRETDEPSQESKEVTLGQYYANNPDQLEAHPNSEKLKERLRELGYEV